MGIKNAGKAKIKNNLGKAPTKETVDTPISECEAENPLNCRFHGLKALEQQLSALLPAMGYKVPFGTDKLEGDKGFEIRIDGKFDVNQGEFKQSLTNAFKQQGWDLTYNGKIEGAGHSFYLQKGKGKPNVEKTSDKDNANIVDSSEASKGDAAFEDAFGDDFNALLEEAELEEPTLKKDPFEGLDDTGLTDEEPTKSENLDSMESIGNPDKLTESDLSDFNSLLEESLGDFDALLEEAEGEESTQESNSFIETKNNLVGAWQDLFDGAVETGLTLSKKYDQKKASEMWKEFNQHLHEEDVEKASGVLANFTQYISKIKEVGDVEEEEPAEVQQNTEMVSGEKGKLQEVKTAGMGVLAEGLMKPLIHNDEAFPSHLSQKTLEKAIYNGVSAGGHGGLQTTIIVIDGKKFVCKKGVGKKSNIIKNGYNADMAYRAGGVYAPDAKLYEYGDGVTYKLSEFIEGKRLIDVWKNADEAKRDSIRKELLKGFPLDALFSNYAVLGTSPEESQTVTITGTDGKPQKTHVAFDNVIIGNDGHAYRIDNDGAFAMTGTGGHKSSSGGSYTVPVEAEQWDNWDERQWIDDFRTMRRNEKNLGIFDRYTTADIFLSAGNINLDNAVSSLPKPLQDALAKPLFEMKQMTYRAVNIELGGFKNNEFVSMALDASYEASKRGLREQCQMGISWNNSGFGKYKPHWGNYQPQPFGEKPPEPPQDPRKVLSAKLHNDEYTGGKIGTIILNAAKTINHHSGVKQTDKDGNVLGNGTAMSNPDYDPNAAKIAEWEKIDRDKLEHLAQTDENAKTLLGLYDTIAYSKENGWKKPIGQIPANLVITAKLPSGYKSAAEKKVLEDMAGAISEFEAKQKEYKKKLTDYEKRKSEHKKKEEAKALAAGGPPYHNFHHFADALMEEGINTDGIAHKVQTNGIQPIESSMSAQKGSSYAQDAVKWKVREMMALGYTPGQILKMAEDGKLYNGSYYTSCINNLLIPKQDSWARDMNSQAMYLGMNMVKMENEQSDLYDTGSGVVFLNRNISNTPDGLTAAEEAIYSSAKKKGWVGPHIDSAADCMQFEKNSWSGSKKQVYAVPFSRIVCCANNDTATGSDFGYVSEQEYVGNLYQLPCWVYHPDNNLTWKNAIDEAQKSDGMKKMLQRFANRLSAFNTFSSTKKQ